MAQYKTLITLIVVILALAAGAFYFTRSKDTTSQQDMTQNNNYSQTQDPTPVPPPPASSDNPTTQQPTPDSAVATIQTTEGSFEITLDGKSAPKTVANFIKLAKEGFYKNLTFHRIVQDFVIQGGDPKGDGTGGPGYTVPAEIKLKHTKGAIAMARLGDAANPTKASSGSQFYVALQDLAMLDGEYTVFGYVTSGMDVVEKIGRVPTEPNPSTGEASVPIKDVLIKDIVIK